jgi:hypothetical protein
MLAMELPTEFEVEADKRDFDPQTRFALSKVLSSLQPAKYPKLLSYLASISKASPSDTMADTMKKINECFSESKTQETSPLDAEEKYTLDDEKTPELVPTPEKSKPPEYALDLSTTEPTVEPTAVPTQDREQTRTRVVEPVKSEISENKAKPAIKSKKQIPTESNVQIDPGTMMSLLGKRQLAQLVIGARTFFVSPSGICGMVEEPHVMPYRVTTAYHITAKEPGEKYKVQLRRNLTLLVDKHCWRTVLGRVPEGYVNIPTVSAKRLIRSSPVSIGRREDAVVGSKKRGAGRIHRGRGRGVASTTRAPPA